MKKIFNPFKKIRELERNINSIASELETCTFRFGQVGFPKLVRKIENSLDAIDDKIHNIQGRLNEKVKSEKYGEVDFPTYVSRSEETIRSMEEEIRQLRCELNRLKRINKS